MTDAKKIRNYYLWKIKTNRPSKLRLTDQDKWNELVNKRADQKLEQTEKENELTKNELTIKIGKN